MSRVCFLPAIQGKLYHTIHDMTRGYRSIHGSIIPYMWTPVYTRLYHTIHDMTRGHRTWHHITSHHMTWYHRQSNLSGRTRARHQATTWHKMHYERTRLDHQWYQLHWITRLDDNITWCDDTITCFTIPYHDLTNNITWFDDNITCFDDEITWFDGKITWWIRNMT